MTLTSSPIVTADAALLVSTTTISVTPKAPVRPNTTVQVTGTVNYDRHFRSGLVVTLASRIQGGQWVAVRNGLTDINGAYSFTVGSGATGTEFQVGFAGTNFIQPSRAAVMVPVITDAPTGKISGTYAPNASIIWRGVVNPAYAGATIVLDRQVPANGWLQVAEAKVAVGGSFSLKVPAGPVGQRVFSTVVVNGDTDYLVPTRSAASIVEVAVAAAPTSSAPAPAAASSGTGSNSGGSSSAGASDPSAAANSDTGSNRMQPPAAAGNNGGDGSGSSSDGSAQSATAQQAPPAPTTTQQAQSAPTTAQQAPPAPTTSAQQAPPAPTTSAQQAPPTTAAPTWVYNPSLAQSLADAIQQYRQSKGLAHLPESVDNRLVPNSSADIRAEGPSDVSGIMSLFKGSPEHNNAILNTDDSTIECSAFTMSDGSTTQSACDLN